MVDLETGGTSLRNDLLALAHDLRNPLGAITLNLAALREATQSVDAGPRLTRALDAIGRSAGRMEKLLDQLSETVHRAAARLPGAGTNSGRPTLALAPDAALSQEDLQTLGLAFLHELLRLRGGDVTTAVGPDGKTTFSIVLPPRASPAPATPGPAVTPLPRGAAAALQSALRWLPDDELRRTLEASFPTVEEAPSAPVFSEPARSAPCEGRLLLAEDNAELRSYVQQLLSDRWVVEAVGDGATALRMAQEHPPDMVLADIMMPGIDGLSLVRQLRADPRTQRIPILLLSAQVGQESKMEGSLAGADDYLVKPFTARELLARVTLHLELSRERARSSSEQARAERAEAEQRELSSSLERELGAQLPLLRRAFEQLMHAGKAEPSLAGAIDAAGAALSRLEERWR